jgi:Uncharacterized conserved protein
VFGRFPLDYSYDNKDIRIRLSNTGSLLRYERECRGSREERYLSRSFSALHIYPVEPVNLPEPLTRYLEIAFPPVVLPPGAEQTVYVKFPVEIGVFLEPGGKQSPLDVFSLVPVKFSLYGLPSSGVITRWFKSDLYPEIPAVDLCREGVMALTLKNSRAENAKVSRAVFDSSSMCLYYGTRVAMTATLEVFSEYLARTTFTDAAPPDCPNRAIDLYRASPFVLTGTKGYFMEAGTS